MGRTYPFDGEIMVVRTQGHIFEGRVIEEVDTTITTSHFATCPVDWKQKAAGK